MKSSIYVKRQSFEVRLNSVISFVFVAFCQSRILRYSTRDVTDIFAIAMFLVTSPIVINVPTRGLLAVETMHAIVQWLANLNIKRNMASMFVNKKHRYNRLTDEKY